MKKYSVGYTTGVFDLFHIGHLNLLKRAKEMCEFLIVGVSIDDLVDYKNKRAVIPFNERIEIVSAIKYVDKAVPQEDLDKVKAHSKYNFDVVFVGSDWQGTTRWCEIEKQMYEKGVDVVYFPYTIGTSSTLLNQVLLKLRDKTQ